MAESAEAQAPTAGADAPAAPQTEETQRLKGTVKWFNATKGFGFITPSDDAGEAKEDLFVHQTSIQVEGFRSLREGEEVEYDVEESPDGRTKAVNVTGPGGANPLGAPRRASRGSGTPVAGAAPSGGSGAFRGGGRGRGPGPAGPAAGYFYPPAGYGYYPGGYYPGAYYPPPHAFPGMRGGRGMRGRGRFGGGRGAEGAAEGGESSGLQVVVHNLPWSCTWQQLKDTFREWKVERADIVLDHWGKSRGFGTVRFTTREDAEAAIEKLNNSDFEGRTITVRLDRYA